jgi:hypothetical protein
METEVDHLEAPWQGRIRPEVTFLDTHALLSREPSG